MDNASDYGSEDSRFESWQARIVLNFFFNFHTDCALNLVFLLAMIRYIYYWNLHFLICVIIPRARVTMAVLLVVLLCKNFWVACLSSLSILSVPNADCSAGASCALSLISTLFATTYLKKKTGFDWNNLKEKGEKKSVLPGGESNPGLPRDRRGYSPLYYRGLTQNLQIEA